MKKLLSLSFVALYLAALPVAALAQSGSATDRPAKVYFDPGSGTVELDSSGQFDVDVIVDTGDEDSAGADVIVEFDVDDLEFVSGTYPSSTSFYPNSNVVSFPSPSNANSSGRISMARTVSAPAPGDPVNYTNGTGIFATLTFEPKVDVGDVVVLDFDFTLGDTTDTNVTGTDSEVNPDILGEATLARLTIAEGGDNDFSDAPNITHIVPTEGPEDEDVQIAIHGTNFGDDEGKVYIGSRLAEIVSWTDTKVEVLVPQVDVNGDKQYQVKLQTADDLEDTYLGYTYLDQSGLAAVLWMGILPLNGVLAYWVKRRWFSAA